MLLNCGAGEDSWESLGLQDDPTSPFWRRSVLSVHWKDWSWSWNSNTLATSCEELTHWERPWCWERLRAGEEGNREWNGWMASPTRWTCVWVNSRSWWWTGRPGMLRFMGSQRVGHDWATELSWTTTTKCPNSRQKIKKEETHHSLRPWLSNPWAATSQGAFHMARSVKKSQAFLLLRKKVGVIPAHNQPESCPFP